MKEKICMNMMYQFSYQSIYDFFIKEAKYIDENEKHDISYIAFENNYF